MQTTTYKTPGVYVAEQDAFPSSAVGVATAVPAFIGYTQMAVKNGVPIPNKPQIINSIDDFELYFGGPPMPQFDIKAVIDPLLADFRAGTSYYELGWTKEVFILYNCMRFFYENGGGTCYVVSVGSYTDTIAKSNFTTGLKAISDVSGPTMLLCPDALMFSLTDKANYDSIMQTMLAQCELLQDRVALLDVYRGYEPEYLSGIDTINTIEEFRTGVGSMSLNYGMGYYPWLNTSIVQSNEVNYLNIEDGTSGIDMLKTVLKEQAAVMYTGTQKDEVDALIDSLTKTPTAPLTVTSLSQDIGAAVPLLYEIYADMQAMLNVLPPASALAGIYTRIDTLRGVWKAPANVSVNSVISATVNVDDQTQADMNVPINGKAVNALRSFPGQGMMVWGARTLEGNSQDYRYINVRRTLIYIEQSLKKAASTYLFEPNDANTWVSVKSMMDNFLMSVWQAGGLMGEKPTDAYSVAVGLGSTMTANDVLDGIMNVEVLLQMLRPAEFIKITFQQKMQGA